MTGATELAHAVRTGSADIVRSTAGYGEPCGGATLAELFQPREDSAVEFWCHRMGTQGVAGTGIRGWFRRGLFWSHDDADHYALGEVTYSINQRL